MKNWIKAILILIGTFGWATLLMVSIVKEYWAITGAWCAITFSFAVWGIKLSLDN